MKRAVLTALAVLLLGTIGSTLYGQQGTVTPEEGLPAFNAILIESVAKSIPTLFVALITLSLGWFVGNKISYRWSFFQEHKKYYLSAINEFHALYGEFFAVWKLWNYYKEDDSKCPQNCQWILLERASGAEAKMEALFVRLASERSLTIEEQGTLGKFRQAYQQLREHIRAGDPLPWASSEHSGYAAFKRLAAGVARIVLPGELQADEVNSFLQLQEITSNKWEDSWTRP